MRCRIVIAVLLLADSALTQSSALAQSGEATTEDAALIVADEGVEPAPVYNQAVSVHLFSLAVAGLSGQYEHYTIPRYRLSLSGVLAFRANAKNGDYSSYSYGAGVELRHWFRERAVWSSLVGRTMAGPYVGARLDFMHTRVKAELEDRTIGGALTFAESLALGYRFLIVQRIEVTPSVEFSARTETDTSGRLGAWTRFSVGFGLSLGYLFR
ncbi:MAG: hypothetical protein JKY56_21665 [Kofleriaceae bacterium]|nr:hypothetical protein [Kofleriaceae bacterium]